MEKPVECKACRRWFRVAGEWDITREVPHTVTCPNCGEPNEVYWPANIQLTATR